MVSFKDLIKNFEDQQQDLDTFVLRKCKIFKVK